MNQEKQIHLLKMKVTILEEVLLKILNRTQMYTQLTTMLEALNRLEAEEAEDSSSKSLKKCCNSASPFGKCGRGEKDGCQGIHCKCMGDGCPNMHYVDCRQHYIHIESKP